MGSRIKSFFFLGRSTKNDDDDNNNNNHNLQAAKPYHSIPASDPPLRGSYPVAGNGPVVLEQVQLQRQYAVPSIVAPSPNIPRRRDDAIQRPRTAPHKGTPGGGLASPKSVRSLNGRSMSGFSLKSPPSFFSSTSNGSRRNSMRASSEQPPLPLPPHSDPSSPLMSRISSPTSREIKTYTRTGSNNFHNQSPPLPATPPFAHQQHSRTTSAASHKSHVDILDAHSTIKRTRATSLHQTRASRARDYGEDVADRNIDAFGERAYRDPKLDLSSPEFGYLKSEYASKKGIAREEPHSRAGSALSRGPEPEGTSVDDTHRPRRHAQERAHSMPRSGPQSTPSYPPRTDSTAAAALSYGNGRARGDHHSPRAPAPAPRQAMPPLSSGTASISEDPRAGNRQNLQFVNSSRAPCTPPIPERGRLCPVTNTTTSTPTSSSPPSTGNSRPVPQWNVVPLNLLNRDSGATVREATSSNHKHRSMSAASQSAIVPPASGTRSRKGSASYSSFPQTSDDVQASSRPATSNRNKQTITEAASEPFSLEGIVNLKDSVDTDVTTRQLPAVLHEHVTPTRHEIHQQVLTREIHNHDVYHRILPVVDTEILPTRHYIRSQDGHTLFEIPEPDVPRHTTTGTSDPGWHLFKPGPSTIASAGCGTASRASTDSAPDGPVIGLARGEPPSSRPGGNSTAIAQSLKSNFKREPILSSKKESTSTKDGIPRTEYVWRHPPVFETATGQTQQSYTYGIGGGDLNTTASGNGKENQYPYAHSDEGGELGAEFGAARTTAAQGDDEEELLFRDSGYGAGGMLPGLTEVNPASLTAESLNRNVRGRGVRVEAVGSGRNVHRRGEGGAVNIPPMPECEATKALGRIKERRRSGVRDSGRSGVGTSDIEDRMRDMRIK